MEDVKKVDVPFPKDFHRIEIPTAAALFPAEMSELATTIICERIFNIKRWTEDVKGWSFCSFRATRFIS